MNRQDAINHIRNLMTAHNITADDLTDSAPMRTQGIQKMFYYLGGLLIFSGLGVFISMFWNNFGISFQVLSTFGIGFVVFIMALIACRDQRYDQLATPLFLISSFMQPFGLLVWIAHMSSGGNPAMALLFISGFMLLQQIPVFIRFRRTALVFTMLFFFGLLVTNLFDLLNILAPMFPWVGLGIGTSFLMICIALAKTRHRAVTGFWFLVSSLAVIISFWDIVENSIYEIFYLGLCAYLVHLATQVSSRALLFISSASILWYIGMFTHEHFQDTLGWPIVLMITGISFIAIGGLVLKLTKRMD